MINEFIKDMGIVNVNLIDLSDEYNQAKSRLQKEKIEKTVKKEGRIKYILFLWLSVAMIFISIFNLSGDDYISCQKQTLFISLLIFFSILLMLSYSNLFGKRSNKIIKTTLQEEEIRQKVNLQIDSLALEHRLADGNVSKIHVLGKIFHNTQHKITGNISNDFIGDVYLATSEDKSQYSLFVYNPEEKCKIVKDFSITDIILCKIRLLDYDPKHYEVDDSAMMIASKNAHYARLERSISKTTVGARENLFQAVSNDKKLIKEAEERKALKRKMDEMVNKKKNETEILDLQFKDGSIFHINHINNSTLQYLQIIIEKNIH